MKALGIFLTVVGVILLVALIVFAIVRFYGVKIGCEDYLKLAGDAPTIQRAYDFLDKAVGYIERHGLTSGNSAIIIQRPGSDIGIWYNQVKGAKETLTIMIAKGDAASQLEKDNALMKIREVVLDEGKKGMTVTMPPNITLFPLQLLFWILIVVGVTILLIGILTLWAGRGSNSW